MAKIGTEIKAMMQNTQSTDFRLCSFDFPSQELIFAATYNSAEYCRFENIDPDPLATEAGRFVLLGNSANATDAHSKLAKQFSITRGDSKTLGLSCLPNSSQAYSKSRGWVNGKTLKVGEEVLAYNKATDCTEFTPVLENYYFIDQEVWAQSGKSRTLLSTLNHRWVTGGTSGAKGKFNLAMKTTSEVIVQTSGTKVLHSASYNKATKSLLTPNEARVLTWLLTDGTWGFYPSLHACIYQAKPIFKGQIKKLLLAENAYCSERISNGTNEETPVFKYAIKAEYFHGLLEKCGQAGVSKKDFNFSLVIPQLNLKAIRACAYVMIKAEGHSYSMKTGSFLVGQNAGNYADDIATVLFLAGYQIRRNKPALQRTGNYAHNVYAIKRRYSTTRYDKNYLHSVEDVWCITTALDTFVTRQADGFITITGNCLYSAGITSCCNLLRPTLGLKYNDKELKTLVTDYIRHFKGTRARGDYLYQGGLFSHFFNYITWLISQPVPRLQFGGQAITNTLRPEWCGNDYFTSRANWPVQGMGAYLLDCMGYEIDKKVFEAGLEDFIWYQLSVHDQLSYMCHESAVDEWASITRKAYKTVWSNFFKSFRMTCPQEVFDNLELTSDVVDRKSVDTNLCTASGKSYFTGLPNGLIV